MVHLLRVSDIICLISNFYLHENLWKISFDKAIYYLFLIFRFYIYRDTRAMKKFFKNNHTLGTKHKLEKLP